MHHPNNDKAEQAGEISRPVSSESSPPPWHQTESGPVKLRSLLHDSDEAEEHQHDTFELILNMGSALGAIVWRNADGLEKTVSVSADQCCLIPAGVTHSVTGLRAEGVVSLLVGEGLLTEPLQGNLTEVTVDSVRSLTLRDGFVWGLVAEFGQALRQHTHALMVNALSCALALKLIQQMSYRFDEYVLRHPPFMASEQAKALDYVREHSTERIRIADMAKTLGMSRTHFSRRFRATFGMSPLQYALKWRVDHALELLRSGQYRVAEAALAVGFCDQSHFDRHCRKFYTRSPRAMLRE